MTTTNKLFLLTECIDEGVMRMWYFHADSILEVAESIVNGDQNRYYDLVQRLGWRPGARRYETPTPNEILERINDSHVDGDSASGFQLFEINLDDKQSIQAEEVYTYRN